MLLFVLLLFVLLRFEFEFDVDKVLVVEFVIEGDISKVEFDVDGAIISYSSGGSTFHSIFAICDSIPNKVSTLLKTYLQT